MRRGTERWSVGREGRLREGFGGGGMTERSTSRDPAGRNEREGPGGINIVADAFNHALDHESSAEAHTHPSTHETWPHPWAEKRERWIMGIIAA